MFLGKIIFCFLILSFSIVSPAYPDPQLGLAEDELLDTIQRQTFSYFLSERDSGTGLVKDKAHNFKPGIENAATSIAATGFALTAYGVGVKRNWMDYTSAKTLTVRTLDFALNHAAQEHGFFYHFLEPSSGERTNSSEVSPIDTALFLAGVLFAAEFYEDSRIRDTAVKIYERVDWPWMLNLGETFALSWSPEEGFNQRRWDHYDESMILYLLAIGSTAHPIPAASWKAIARPVGSYKNYRMIQMPPLFTHQYSHIWIDFRDQNDGFADYFHNSVNASRANRAFAMEEAAHYKSYGANSWGLTAANGPFGYRAYGAPPGWAQHDGTVSPAGCGSSIVFTPKESIECLRYFYENMNDKLWGEYGFSGAFNLDKNWFDSYVIGIDQGALLLMIENYRSSLIWETMKKNLNLQNAMKEAGFMPGTKELPWPEPPEYKAPYLLGGVQVDGYLKDWPHTDLIGLDRSYKEFGSVQDEKDLKADIRFAWNEDALFFVTKVSDSDVITKKSGKNIWQDDCFEVFIDPQADGLIWNDPADFQIGFRPEVGGDQVKIWSWFQSALPDVDWQSKIAAKGFVHGTGYVVEGAILWSLLGIRPAAGSVVRISPAVHDLDRDHSEGKLQWFFRNEEKPLRFVLGKVKLEGREL